MDVAVSPSSIKCGDFISGDINHLDLHFPKMNKPPQNVEYHGRCTQNRNINPAPEWETTEDQEEVDN